MAARRLIAVAGACAFLAPSTAASAHGPCGCLDPRVAQVGTTVRIAGYPAYRVIVNPGADELGIAPSYLASAYRSDAPTTTVLSRSRHAPTRRGRFRVPDLPTGLYMVLVFDGEEGGAHNTWDYLHVIDPDNPEAQDSVTAESERSRPAATARGSAPSDSDRHWVLPLATATAGVVLGATAVALRHRRALRRGG